MSLKENNQYKSSPKKLAVYFEASRDKWRERSSEKQKRIDYLETKLRDVENSRNKWKNCAKSLQKELKKN